MREGGLSEGTTELSFEGLVRVNQVSVWGQWSVAVWGTVAKRRVYVSSRGDRGSVSGADC